MKNLAKPLTWKEHVRNKTELAYLPNFGTAYLVYKDERSVSNFTAQFEIEESIIWKRTGLNTLYDAKYACQQHYAKSLWDNLSPEARDILEKHLNP